MTESRPRLPPGQQLAADDKWPFVGEREPRTDGSPWSVAVSGLVSRPLKVSLEELSALPQVERTIDIHCVTRWSKFGLRFSGVPLVTLLDAAGVDSAARYVSFVARSERSHSTSLPLADALDLESLVVLRWNGQPLPTEHGGPVRTVVPGRYFYKSLKWLERIELLAEDRLGHWEGAAGYHNSADPWREQRYLAPSLSKQEAQRLIASRDFSGRDLRGIDASGRELRGLIARGALLRDANFRRADLRGACFDRANLTNAHLEGADLRQATFRDADLQGTDFAAADLRGADLTGASLFGASFIAEQHGRTTSPESMPDGCRIDAKTRLNLAQLEDLTPLQYDYLRGLLQ